MTRPETLTEIVETTMPEFASKADGAAWLQASTQDHHCVIVDGDPNLKGHKERYWVYKAVDQTRNKTPLLCPAAWQTRPAAGAAAQRRANRQPTRYKRSYLSRLRPRTELENAPQMNNR